MDYKYYEINCGLDSCIFRMPDGAFIPMDERNGDYRRYLEAMSKGEKCDVVQNQDEARMLHADLMKAQPVVESVTDPLNSEVISEK